MRTLPMGSGVGYFDNQNATMPINIGKVENIGHELTINWNDKVRGLQIWNRYHWHTFNQNKVID